MNWRLIPGKAEKALPELKTGQISLVHFDPPYFPGAIFGNPEKEHLRSYRRPVGNQRIFSRDIDWSLFSGQFARLLKPNGVLGIWGSQPHLMNLYKEFFSQNFRFHQEFVWAKTSANLVVNWRHLLPNHELFWMLVKKGGNFESFNLRRTALMNPRIVNPGFNGSWKRVEIRGWGPKGAGNPALRSGKAGYLHSAMVSQPVKLTDEYLGHPTQKSVEITKRLISFLTQPGDTVLDPMCGSGTTLLAAEMLGRYSIGIEMNPAYAKLAINRLEAWNGS